jgi:Ca2+-binding RTX toxin-like protein
MLSIVVLSLPGSNNVFAINIIIAIENVTIGSDEADLINGCSYLKPECSQGIILDSLEDNDVLQGSSADDTLLGDDGDDELTGSDGNDRLFGEKGKDVLQAGFGGDLLIAGSGNDELYAGSGDDVLIGGADADYFDCENGYDVIVDFSPNKGDTAADNCEVVLTHNAYNIDLLCTNKENAGKYYQQQQSSISIYSNGASKDAKTISTDSNSNSTIESSLHPHLDCTTDDDVSISSNDIFEIRSYEE